MPLAEPQLVGEQHRAALNGLLERFESSDNQAGVSLRPGGGGLVVLTGLSGTGKSRIVRELYGKLANRQASPWYWQALEPVPGATPGPELVRLSAFSFRKVLGPDSQGFVWPHHCVPEYLWFHVTCQTDRQLGTDSILARQLIDHAETAARGARRAKGLSERALEAVRSGTPAAIKGLLGIQASSMVSDGVTSLVPGGGDLVAAILLNMVGLVKRVGDAQERLDNDVILGGTIGGPEDPIETLATVIESWADAKFPVILAVEDLHDADPALLHLLRRLRADRRFTDRILVVATAWPDALAERHISDVELSAWLKSLGAVTINLEPLTTGEARQLVGNQFPATEPGMLDLIASKWTNPLAVALVLDDLSQGRAIDGGRITASADQIDDIPPGLAALYDRQFNRLPRPARLALIVDVICGADADTATDPAHESRSTATWSPVQPELAAMAAAQAGLPDHQLIDHARASNWLTTQDGWVLPKEPAMAAAAWRGIRTHHLHSHALKVRMQAARLLAETINAAAQHPDGTPGLFLDGSRWLVRESTWMMTLSPCLTEEHSVQDATIRASLELFRHRAQVRPREAIHDWGSWAPQWEELLGPDNPETLGSQNNLALAHLEAGDVRRAIQMFEQTLAYAMRLWGGKHPISLAFKNDLAEALHAAGDLERAISLHEETLALGERILHFDHPQVLQSRNNLAAAYRKAGKLTRAITLYEATLRDMIRVLGPDHPTTLTSRNNLAFAYQEAGDLHRAIPLYEATLDDSERILGPEHPQTLSSRSNLAHAYQDAGDLGRATSLYEAVLVDRMHILGPDHPDTLTSRSNLAHAYQEAGDLGSAIPLYEAVLADRAYILGPDHPDTLTSRSRLAHAYQEAGDLVRATSLYEAVLDDYLKILGPDHPETLSCRSSLARAHMASGDFGRAVDMCEKVLADSVRVLGLDHPDTLGYRNNLALAYSEARDWERAIPINEQVLAESRRVLGVNHPKSLIAANNLACVYRDAGDLRQAIPLYEQTLTESLRILGPNHPHTLYVRRNFASALYAAGDSPRAIPLFEQVLEDMLRVLGNDHPNTLKAREELACICHTIGEFSRAVAHFEQLLADRVRLLGPGHPQALSSGHNLAYAHLAIGDPGRAIPLFAQVGADRERVLGPDHPDTRDTWNGLAIARAIAGVPDCDDQLVDYWLQLPNWMVKFEVFDAVEQRLRGPAATARLSALANDNSDMQSEAAQHTAILAAAGFLDRATLFDTVNDAEEAIRHAATAIDNREIDRAMTILGTNSLATQLGAIAIAMVKAVRSGDWEQLAGLSEKFCQFGIAPEVKAALGQLAEHLRPLPVLQRTETERDAAE